VRLNFGDSLSFHPSSSGPLYAPLVSLPLRSSLSPAVPSHLPSISVTSLPCLPHIAVGPGSSSRNFSSFYIAVGEFSAFENIQFDDGMSIDVLIDHCGTAVFMSGHSLPLS